METIHPSTPSTMGLLPSAIEVLTPPPTKKRPLQETTSVNLPLTMSPTERKGLGDRIEIFTPPDSRKKVRQETVLPIPFKVINSLDILINTKGFRTSLARRCRNGIHGSDSQNPNPRKTKNRSS